MPSGQSLPEGLDEVEISKLMEVNESLKNFDVEVIPTVQQQQRDHSLKKGLICKEKENSIFCELAPFSEIIPDSSLVEAFSFVKELSDVLWGVSEQLVLHEKHNALQRG